MNQATRRLSARLRNCMFYSLWLTGEVRASGWGMQADKARLLAAIDVASGPPVTKRRKHDTPPRSRIKSGTVPLPSRAFHQRERWRSLEALFARASSGRNVTLTVCDRGVSVRSRAGVKDVPAFGIWASPIVVDGARLRSLVKCMPGPEVRLEYSRGRLMVDWKAMKAREL